MGLPLGEWLLSSSQLSLIYKEFSLKQWKKCVFPGVRATRAVCL